MQLDLWNATEQVINVLIALSFKVLSPKQVLDWRANFHIYFAAVFLFESRTNMGQTDGETEAIDNGASNWDWRKWNMTLIVS